MARSKSSTSWLKEHVNDRFVKQSRLDGYRSRASYKLLELNDKDQLIKPGMTVLDLGSAPGGWSQVAASLVTETGTVIASDILAMNPIAGVTFVQGDFTEEQVYQDILQAMGEHKADLVISDMAPNMSGVSAVDQPSSMYLVELALDMAKVTLKPGGSFAAKVFQGEGFAAYLADMKRSFKEVVSRKPLSSRARSRELYLVGKGYRSDQLG